MNILLRKLISDVPGDTRENFLRDCFGNVMSGLQTALFCNFFAIVAKKYLAATAFQIAVMNSMGFLCGFVAVIVASCVPLNKENKYIGYMGIISNLFLICAIPFIKSSAAFTTVYIIYCLIASYQPLYMVVIERLYRQEIRAQLMGRAKCFMAVTSIIFSFVGGFVIEKDFCAFESWRIVFMLASLFYICNFIFCFYMWKVPPATEKKESPLKFLKSSFRLLKTDIPNTWLIVSGCFFTVAFVLLNTVIPFYQDNVLHIGPKEIGILLFVQNIFWALGYPVSGKFIAKKGAVAGWILTCAFGAFLPLGYIIITGSWTYLMIFYALFGIFMTGNDLAWANILFHVTKGKNATEYQSLHYFFIAVRGAVALGVSTWTIGFAEKIHLDYRWVFGVVILTFLISSVIICLVFQKNRT